MIYLLTGLYRPAQRQTTTTSLITGAFRHVFVSMKLLSPVYTIQPVVNTVVKPVVKPD